MGGKNKGNRTKNNARPSSSARSAELLGNQVPSFFGFVVGKDGATFTAANDELDNCVDLPFQLAFKKMLKKDGTTKLKALNECATLCNESDSDKVKLILPFWPRLYCQLASDAEHRVRETAHFTHKAIVAKVKKNLAPYLKQIIGVWYTAQFDSYAPAASAAVAAFQEAFSSTKMVEALIYCQESIVEYIIQNLTTPPAQGQSKTVSMEDVENNYCRILSSSLLGYASYIQSVPSEKLRECESVHRRLLSVPKFWKLCQHKDPLPRLGFFKAIVSLMQNAIFLLTAESSRVANVILNYLGEEDPMVLPIVWDAVLHGLVAFPDCWNDGNVKKQLLPKFFNILGKGGKGGARYIYPNVLPLLSQVPDHVVGDLNEFYTKLFDNLRAGLECPSVNRSQSESRAVAAAMVECLQYIILKYKDNHGLVESLIKDHLIVALKTKLAAESTTPCHTLLPFMFHTSQLLRILHRNSTSLNYATDCFWSILSESFTDTLNKALTETEAETVLKSQIDCLLVFLRPGKYIPKSCNERVRFANVDEEPQKPKPTKEIHVPEFNEALEKFVTYIATEYYRLYGSTKIRPFAGGIVQFINTFDASKILKALAGSGDLLTLYGDFLSKQMPKDFLVVLGIALVHEMPENDQIRVLDSLYGAAHDSPLLLCEHLSKCKSSTVHAWLKNEMFSGLFLRLVSEFLKGDGISTASSVIYSFLNPEPLVSTETLSAFVQALKKTVEEDGCVDSVTALTSACSAAVYRLTDFNDFLRTLFSVSCHVNGEKWLHLVKSVVKKANYSRLSIEHGSENTSIPDLLIEALDISKINARNATLVITKYIELTTEVDLSEKCEPEEIVSCSELLQRFLEPSGYVKSCISRTLKNIKQASIIRGDLDLTYFKIDDCYKPTCDKISEYCPEVGDTSDLFVQYLRQELLCLACDGLMSDHDSLESYVNWLHLVGESLMNLVSAYPRSSKIQDLSVSGRYHILGEDVPPHHSDEIPKLLTKEELNRLQEDAAITFTAYPEDEYPDGNYIQPLTKIILSFLQGVAVTKKIGAVASETEHHHLISSRAKALETLTEEVISNLTATEFDYIYSLAKTLASVEPLWYHLVPELSNLIHRRFETVTSSNITDHEVGDIVSSLLTEGFDSVPLNITKLTTIIRNYSSVLTKTMWSDIYVQMDKTMQVIAVEKYIEESHLSGISPLAALYCAIDNAFKDLNDDSDETLKDAASEWTDVVKPELKKYFLKFWVKLGRLDADFIYNVELRGLCEAVVAGISEPSSILEVLELMEPCSLHLLSPSLPLQMTSFHMLKSFIPRLIEDDMEAFQSNISDGPADEEKGLFRNMDCSWRLELFRPVITSCQAVVDAMLDDFKIGDTCTIQPFTDAFAYTHGYLLIWSVLLEMCEKSHAGLAFQYTNWVRNNDFLHSLLGDLFRVMPADIIHCNQTPIGLADNKFIEYVPVALGDEPSSEMIKFHSCYIYRKVLQYMSVAVRDWWAECDHQTSLLVGKATALYVSPILINHELTKAQKADVEALDKISIIVNTIANEMVATYTIDEAAMTITIALPPNYPLGSMKVHLNTQSVASLSRRIHMFLAHRNGSLSDALALWMSHLNKKFESLEECEICFSILHGSKFETPNKSCTTCKKTFHSACLYKWFSMSNKSSCPHCRNLY